MRPDARGFVSRFIRKYNHKFAPTRDGARYQQPSSVAPRRAAAVPSREHRQSAGPAVTTPQSPHRSLNVIDLSRQPPLHTARASTTNSLVRKGKPMSTSLTSSRKQPHATTRRLAAASRARSRQQTRTSGTHQRPILVSQHQERKIRRQQPPANKKCCFSCNPPSAASKFRSMSSQTPS